METRCVRSVTICFVGELGVRAALQLLAPGVLPSGPPIQLETNRFTDLAMSNPILRVIDFFDEIVVGSEKKAANLTVVASYCLFLLCGAVVAKEFSDRDFSAVLTAGSGAQCLGFFLLLHKIKVQGSVAGISSKTLECYVLVLMFRLGSTLFKNGSRAGRRAGAGRCCVPCASRLRVS